MAFSLVSITGGAYESRYLVHVLKRVCENGDAKNIAGEFVLKNVTQQTVHLMIESQQGPQYEFAFNSEQRVLKPNEETIVHYKGSIRADGKFQINVKVSMQVGAEFRATHEVDLYYLVEQGQFRMSTYEELFLQRDVVDKEMGDAFSSAEDNGRVKRGDEYQSPLPSVQQMIDLDRKSIFRIPVDTAPAGCKEGPCRKQPSLKDFTVQDIVQSPPVATLDGILARGEFSYKGMDNLLHPAFGWRVRAWKRILGSIWVVAAEDWIQWDGKWQLNVPTIGDETRFQYVAFNRFFTPMTSSEDTYRWVGPIRGALGSPHNEGSWFADTSTGGARGLGEIYREGMTMWSKLYWEGEINPIRDESIKIFFPNTTYDCGDGSGSPWSCASRDGRIWLIPSHASRNGVTQHELAHQMNYEFWNNNLPSGSGGSHNLTSCYNPGLAVVEGFANFMVFWTQSARNGDPNAGFDFRVENPSFACADPLNVNESWVAANFWDLHDTRGDGSDNLWFIHPGATPGIFLREGMKSGMAAFHPVYRSKANAEHRTIIDAIFRQNNIID